MTNYKSLTFFQNKHRQNILSQFQQKLGQYFSLIDYNSYSRDIVDTDESRGIRRFLNRQNSIVQLYMQEVGQAANVIYTDPPAIGGRRSNLNLLDNIFNLQNYDIEPQTIIDFIDQAIGVYERDFTSSIIRTFNPLFWAGKVLEAIASVPFMVLGRLGLPQQKIESSPLGVIIKWLIKGITAFTTVWQFLVFVGVIPPELSLLRLLKLN